MTVMAASQRFRVLTYNIQVAIGTRRLHHYVTRGWRHVLPFRQRLANLDRTGAVLEDFDLVALQEVDGGSYRGEFLNQAEYLAERARFSTWWMQVNRDYGALAQHGIALLSHHEPSSVDEVRLPGVLPGRGVLVARFGEGDNALVVLVVHLALGYRTRQLQINRLARLVRGERNVIVMGDMNCTAGELRANPRLRTTGMQVVTGDLLTYPSWRPRRNLDHVLISPRLECESASVLDLQLSDHLPVAVDLRLPGDVELPPFKANPAG